MVCVPKQYSVVFPTLAAIYSTVIKVYSIDLWYVQRGSVLLLSKQLWYHVSHLYSHLEARNAEGRRFHLCWSLSCEFVQLICILRPWARAWRSKWVYKSSGFASSGCQDSLYTVILMFARFYESVWITVTVAIKCELAGKQVMNRKLHQNEQRSNDFKSTSWFVEGNGNCLQLPCYASGWSPQEALWLYGWDPFVSFHLCFQCKEASRII